MAAARTQEAGEKILEAKKCSGSSAWPGRSLLRPKPSPSAATQQRLSPAVPSARHGTGVTTAPITCSRCTRSRLPDNPDAAVGASQLAEP